MDSNHSAAVIMTFNLRRASLFDGVNAWRYRKGRAAEAVLASGADFVGTQEGFHSMLQELSALLPGYAWVGEGRRGGTKDEYSAIVYRKDRWTPSESGTFWLSQTPEQPGSRSWGSSYPRICTWAVFRSIPNPSLRILVMNTHLDHISAMARKCGAALAGDRLLELQRQHQAPAILTGDLNTKPRSGPIQLLREHYGLLDAYQAYPGGPGAVGSTYHGFRGGGRGGAPIDYIFASKSCTIVRTQVDRNRYQGKFPSDHFPVCAHISWKS
jgi:endonuclease/exonuclease/phosphatase family metal-dependent hydrolase